MLLKGGGVRAGLSTEAVLGIISFSRSPVVCSYGAMLVPLVAAQHTKALVVCYPPPHQRGYPPLTRAQLVYDLV